VQLLESKLHIDSSERKLPPGANNNNFPPPITALQNATVTTKNVDPSPSKIFVISLQGTPGVHKSNEGRLDTFKEQWLKACGSSSFSSTQIEHCPGVYIKQRGYGIVLSWYFCLMRAKELDLEVAVVFEDDARLFDTMTADFCDVKRRGELFSKLPSDAFLAFLGGHSWSYAKAKLAVPYQEVIHSYGAYGFAVPRQSLDMLRDSLRHGLDNGSKDRKGNTHHNSLDPEPMFYRAARKFRRKIYASDPLVVWHEGGYSNSWGKERGNITGIGAQKQGIVGSSGTSNSTVGLPRGINGGKQRRGLGGNGGPTTNVTTFEPGSTPAIYIEVGDCLGSVNARTLEMMQHFALSEGEFGKLDPKHSWAGKAGILSNRSDFAHPIDCHLFRPSDKRTIYFLHIHKSGGTSLCASAHANHHFANFNEGCNAHVDACTDPTLTKRTNLFQFVANEWPLCDDMDSQKYRYVVQIRKSASRYKSDYMVAAAGIMPLQQWLDLQPDNFLTRMLCGLRCLRRPKFQLTHEDHLYTLNRLENFDNIILLEHFDDTFGKFASEVGWRNNAGKVITPWTTKRHKMLQHSKHQIADDNSISERYTILDDALY
jgi:hypothetical protein